MERGCAVDLNPSGQNEVNVRRLFEPKRKDGGAAPREKERGGGGKDGAAPSPAGAGDEGNDLMSISSDEQGRRGEDAAAQGDRAATKKKFRRRQLHDEYDYDDRFIDDGDLRYEMEPEVRATKYTGFYINRGDILLAPSGDGAGGGDSRQSVATDGTGEDGKLEGAKSRRDAKGGGANAPGALLPLPDAVEAAVVELRSRIFSTFGTKKPNLADSDVQDGIKEVFRVGATAGLAKLEGLKPGSEKRFAVDNVLWKHLSVILRCLRLNLETLGHTLHWTKKKEESGRAVEAAQTELMKAIEAIEGRSAIVLSPSDGAGGHSGGGGGAGASASGSGVTDREKPSFEFTDEMDHLIHAVCVSKMEHLYHRNQLSQRPKKAAKELPGWLHEMRKRRFGNFAVTEKALGEAFRRVEAVYEAERAKRRLEEKEERRRKKEEELQKLRARAALKKHRHEKSSSKTAVGSGNVAKESKRDDAKAVATTAAAAATTTTTTTTPAPAQSDIKATAAAKTFAVKTLPSPDAKAAPTTPPKSDAKAAAVSAVAMAEKAYDSHSGRLDAPTAPYSDPSDPTGPKPVSLDLKSTSKMEKKRSDGKGPAPPLKAEPERIDLVSKSSSADVQAHEAAPNLPLSAGKPTKKAPVRSKDGPKKDRLKKEPRKDAARGDGGKRAAGVTKKRPQGAAAAAGGTKLHASAKAVQKGAGDGKGGGGGDGGSTNVPKGTGKAPMTEKKAPIAANVKRKATTDLTSAKAPPKQGSKASSLPTNRVEVAKPPAEGSKAGAQAPKTAEKDQLPLRPAAFVNPSRAGSAPLAPLFLRPTKKQKKEPETKTEHTTKS